jgi:plastocyanin
MAHLRLIKIRLENGTTVFEPAALGADIGDRIHWSNETNEDHWLETSDGKFITNNIRAGDVSDPGYPASDQTVTYRCKLHPDEQGQIVVHAAVAPAAAPAIVAAAMLARRAACTEKKPG